MAFRLEFYRTITGTEPALDYIRSQIKGHRSKIGRALQYLEDVGHLARRHRIVIWAIRFMSFELRSGNTSIDFSISFMDVQLSS